MDRFFWPFRPILNPSTSLFGIFHKTLIISWIYRCYSYIHVQLQQVYRLLHEPSVSRFWQLTNLKDDLFPERIWNFECRVAKLCYLIPECDNATLLVWPSFIHPLFYKINKVFLFMVLIILFFSLNLSFFGFGFGN